MFRSRVSILASTLALAAGCISSGTENVQTEEIQGAVTILGPTNINAGGGATGNWLADQFFTNGRNGAQSAAAIVTTGITNPAPQVVYQTSRVGTATYNIGPFAGDTATVRLHFAETFHVTPPGQAVKNQTGARTFNVDINGMHVLTNFDVWATAAAMAPVKNPISGDNRAVVQSFDTSTDANGFIKIVFTTVKDNAMISGIEVTNTASPKLPSPLGSACSSNAGCLSNFCVGGTCCQSACTGFCDKGNSCDSSGVCTHNVGKYCQTVKGSNTPYNDIETFCNAAGTCAGPTFTCGNTGTSCTVDGTTQACCARAIVNGGTTTWTSVQCGAANTCAGNYGENCKSNRDCPTGQFCCFDGGYGFGWSVCHKTACDSGRQECNNNNADCANLPGTTCQNYNGTDFTCF
jgi:hypothetical protein